jgi:hypothetical protein
MINKAIVAISERKKEIEDWIGRKLEALKKPIWAHGIGKGNPLIKIPRGTPHE